MPKFNYHRDLVSGILGLYQWFDLFLFNRGIHVYSESAVVAAVVYVPKKNYVANFPTAITTRHSPFQHPSMWVTKIIVVTML